MITAASLQKGQKIDLTKGEPDLKKLKIGLGWKKRATEGEEFDLDAMAFLLNAEGKARSDADFVYYHNPASACGSVKTTGDNRNGGSGGSDGDNETILIDLSTVPDDVARIQIVVSIHEAEERRQNFGMVQDAYVRVVDEEKQEEKTRFDLSEEYSLEKAVVMGELYRHNGEWKFGAVGQGYAGGLIDALKVIGLA